MKIASSLKHLFVSATRQKLVAIFFSAPQEIFYVRQLVRSTDEEINSVRRELENLKNADIVLSEARGNRLFYYPNPNSPLFNNLLVLANKTSGLAQSLAVDKNQIGHLKMLLYSYDFMLGKNNNKSSIDLIIIGDVSLKEIESHISKEQERRNREINYMVMDKNELQLRKRKRDPFLVDFFLNCPQIIIGNPLDIINL